MTRSFLIALLLGLSAQSAFAGHFIFRGKIASRETCLDQGVFSSSKCSPAALGKKRDCTVSLTTDYRGNLRSIQIASPAWVETGDHRKESLSGSLTSPYLYKDDFVAYITKLDQETSAEVKISGTRVLGAYIYTNHVQSRNAKKAATRTFNQYFCTNLSLVKQAL
ncbi:MAG: hypothetical protein KF789_10275 [Bdellovibrionaceae bacterium]|nr:hypothetical protein [Pseudobdellovibrionaceae bacterium]